MNMTLTLFYRAFEFIIFNDDADGLKSDRWMPINACCVPYCALTALHSQICDKMYIIKLLVYEFILMFLLASPCLCRGFLFVNLMNN